MTYPTKKLNDLLETCDAGAWGKPAMSGKGLFVLRSTNMTNDGHLDFSDVAERKIEGDTKKVKLSDGDILVEKSGGGPDQPVGRVAHFTAPNDRAYSFANFIQRLRVKSKLIDSRFLFYRLLFLHKIGFTKKLQSQTTGIRNLKISLYLKTEIPLPPLNTQKQIVERLDKIAEAQKLNNDLIQKSDELFQSLLHSLIRANSRIENWPIKKLGEVVDFLDNLRRPVTASDRVLGPYPYYGANGQQDSVSDYIFDDELVLLAEDGGYFGSKTRPVAYRVSGKCWVNNHAHVLKNKGEVCDIDFLGYSLMYYDVTPYVTGSTRAKLNKSAAEKIKIPIPSLETQKQIVEKLSSVQNYKNELLQQKTKLKELFDSVLHKSFQHS